MTTNLDRFQNDLEALLKLGQRLQQAMTYECHPDRFAAAVKEAHGKKATACLKDLPSFKNEYQGWYSEALAFLRQVLPDRVADFTRHYEKPKGRKDIDYENYRVEDYLQGLQVTRGYPKEVVVDSRAAIPQFQQQLAIVAAAKARFTSSLFEVRQLVQADLLDSELEAAELLAKHKFVRAAGAVAGVVLEKHLGRVCADHNLSTGKKNPTISDFNEALKAAGTIDVPQWRFIQHLADIRNLCDHGRTPEPTLDQANDLLQGVKKIIKTVF